MKPFVFSCDAHVVEPDDLFTSNMPSHLQQYALAPGFDPEKQQILLKMGDEVLLRLPKNFHQHKVGDSYVQDDKPQGSRHIAPRLEDMARDGIDAELIYGTAALFSSHIADSEASVLTSQIYNDWLMDYTKDYRNTLVGAASVPLSNPEDCLAETERAIKIGYKAIMLPPIPTDTMPHYNDPAWDPIFAACGEANVPVVMHTATGKVPVQGTPGPGTTVAWYTRQINDAIESASYLVGGGVLDRNPNAKVMYAETGAGWMLAAAERMDEVYDGHEPYVRPKLSRMPSQIMCDQVYSSFQNDTGCLMTRKGLSIKNMMFATDYPHAEGTFPVSQNVIETIFDRVPDLTQEEKEAVLGLNALEFFNIKKEDVIAEKAKAA